MVLISKRDKHIVIDEAYGVVVSDNNLVNNLIAGLSREKRRIEVHWTVAVNTDGRDYLTYGGVFSHYETAPPVYGESGTIYARLACGDLVPVSVDPETHKPSPNDGD